MTEYALKLTDEELTRYRFMAETALRMEADLWATAGIVQGAAVADVGCGPGAVSQVMARLVGPAGRVAGVDGDSGTVETARSLAGDAGMGNVAFSVGRADDTGLAPESFDTVMIRHVLAHNGAAEQSIVNHAASLVRPGGHVYLLDIDASAFRMRPEDPDFEDLNDRYYDWHARRGNDLSVGLRLGELLTGAGLELVEFEGRYQIFPVRPGMRAPAWAARESLLDAGMATPETSPAGKPPSSTSTRWRIDRRSSSPCSSPSPASRAGTIYGACRRADLLRRPPAPRSRGRGA